MSKLLYTPQVVVLVVKNPPASAGDAGDLGLISGSGRTPGGGHGNPLQFSHQDNPHGQRSLVDYSPWGRKRVRHNQVTEHHTHHTIDEPQKHYVK